MGGGGARNLVLVGPSGTGKSATGNTILGRKAFRSRRSSVVVTRRCELESFVDEEGRAINLIDTPGLFDLSTNANFIHEEIKKCTLLAEGGIHAFLLVISLRSRCTLEVQSSLHQLQTILGKRIAEYIIIVFTGADELEEIGMTLEGYLAQGYPNFLKELFSLCDYRVVLFNNTDQLKSAEQVDKLFEFVDSVFLKNRGRPFKELQERETVKMQETMLRETEETMPRKRAKMQETMQETMLRDTVKTLETKPAKTQETMLTKRAKTPELQKQTDDGIGILLFIFLLRFMFHRPNPVD